MSSGATATTACTRGTFSCDAMAVGTWYSCNREAAGTRSRADGGSSRRLGVRPLHALRERPHARRLPGVPRLERVEPARQHAARRRGLGAADRLDRAHRRRPRRLRLGPLRRPVDRHPVRRRQRQDDAQVDASSSTTRTRATRARTRSRATSRSRATRTPATATATRSSSTAAPCKLYELYALRRAGSGWAAGSGAIWNLRSNALRPSGWTSADAAGLPILPGLALLAARSRPAQIDHALRFTASRTRNTFIYPARHEASSSSDPVAAADGAPRPAEGERRHLEAATAGPDRRAGDEDATG